MALTIQNTLSPNAYSYNSAPPVSTDFKITVDTTKAGSASDTFVLPLQVGTTSMTVYWGDGNSDVITAYNQAELTHVYASSGTYQISCDGSFAGIYFAAAGDKLKLASIDNWGTNTWSKTTHSFNGCSNMVGTYTDSLDASLAGNFLGMFKGCTSFNSDLTIDTSLATSMQAMFYGCTTFNGNVTFSDTSSVNRMLEMFWGCTNFNKPVSFDTSANTRFQSMFYNCTNFDQAVNFDTSSALFISSMFTLCTSFNQTINFDLTSINSSINYMFAGCSSLNSAVNLTNTSGVTNLQGVFQNCTVFNQDISAWNISGVTVATIMLQGTAFSTTNYDLLLVAWQGQAHNSSVNFHAGTAQYSSGAPATARAALITDSWTITDGGAV